MNFDIILLSIIQGLTEFLPVSSSAHLALAPRLLGLTEYGLDMDAFLHLGTLLAALIYFRKEILAMLSGLVIASVAKQSSKDNKINRKLALAILLATLPAIAVGFSFKDFFGSDLVRSSMGIAITLVLGSLLMFVADRYSKKQISNKEITDLGYTEIFFIGIMQCLALFPGVSRSGSTISAGLFATLNREQAARFSFIVGLPAIAGAGLLALKDLLTSPITNLDYQELGIGFLVSFVAGYLAIDFMIKFLKSNSLIWFIVYRIILAGFIIL
ncbi:MAG: undecaprenyl-diphosphatase UppP [Cyanobacteria bacterium]|nr:undecaprenyl-diphosphatase UppP [Cyanobacteriota bacterium]MDA1021639.1 undecaprenyl-diphosphatase UppP [Cyanobacteriota bacterium]